MAANFTKLSNQANLCDYCHLRPKFANHRYCSKTCAGQAAPLMAAQAPLCKQCHQKPKHQMFDYCGKTCAALAKTSGGAMGFAAVQQPSTIPYPVRPPAPQAQAPGKFAAAAPAVPQGLPTGYNGATQLNPIPPGGQKLYQAQPIVSPNQGSIAPPHAFNSGQMSQALCLVPGCGKPVYRDAQGALSTYCSIRHRDEAAQAATAPVQVATAPPSVQEPLCIMCSSAPQRDVDYFCSTDCRDKSLSKLPVDAYPEYPE